VWAAVGIVGTSVPWWGPRLVAPLAFFRLRAVEVVGTRYVEPGDVVARLHVDTTTSVWRDLEPLTARAAMVPGVQTARITRKLPGTLVVHVVERRPVAWAAEPGGLQAVDPSGAPVPVDPSRADVDLPVVVHPDRHVVRVLGGVRDTVPALFNQISEVRRLPGGDYVFQLLAVPVLAGPDVSASRLAEALIVASDLARRHIRPTVLDLRYRDQVVARLP
jgi:cell division protein FtsQ